MMAKARHGRSFDTLARRVLASTRGRLAFPPMMSDSYAVLGATPVGGKAMFTERQLQKVLRAWTP